MFVASKIGKIQLPKELSKRVTVKNAIGWLPEIKAGQTCKNDLLHTASNLSYINLERIRASKPGGHEEIWPERLLPACYKKATGKTFSVVYGRIDPNKPAPTLTTQFNRYGTGRYGHYEQDRALSWERAL
ncbi:DNA cytosine methyltransferase [Mycoplasma sp. ATU-Cv-508]|uniref:DNA cytosine methyltransferase n=1 Tax=Mycoplasma sp. ATU-Cv-508 TaxID=2048001 RepID=UPI000FDF204F